MKAQRERPQGERPQSERPQNEPPKDGKPENGQSESGQPQNMDSENGGCAGKGRKTENMELEEILSGLDEIDRQMAALYIERLKKNAEIAEKKLKQNLPVDNRAEEERKLGMVRAASRDRFVQEALEELYKQILSVSRRYQYLVQSRHGVRKDLGFSAVDQLPAPKKVVYQGIEGAYGNMAAEDYFREFEDVQFYHVAKFEDAIREVESERADYAVLPIENSTVGPVVDTLDILMRHSVSIVGEYFLPVRHCLLALPGVKTEEIRSVCSHPQALLQCADFFRKHPEIRQMPADNTAIAAKKVRSDGDRTQAAIASALSAKLYGLNILIDGLNQQEENTTRFIVAGREKIYRFEAKKTSMVLETAHEAGALYNLLGSFFFNRINMVKLESRPIPDVPWDYRFFVDIDGSLSDPAVINALTAIAQQARGFRILGCY